MMTSQSSTAEDTKDSLKSLASYKSYTKAETEDICADVWDELYQKDKFFVLYTPQYKGWRYTVYGDDLASVTTSINVCWLHTETWIPSPRKRTCLANLWEQEGYP